MKGTELSHNLKIMANVKDFQRQSAALLKYVLVVGKIEKAWEALFDTALPITPLLKIPRVFI